MLEGSEVLAVIPARYASTRLPGKPLALIAGKPMIQHVWERVSALLPAVVATDDARIAEVVYSFGGRVRMTSVDCPNGTARVAEVLANWEGPRPEIVLNVQGDEPLVLAHDLETLVRLMRRPEVRIGTLVSHIIIPIRNWQFKHQLEQHGHTVESGKKSAGTGRIRLCKSTGQ